jgi:hypothetical protein
MCVCVMEMVDCYARRQRKALQGDWAYDDHRVEVGVMLHKI